MRFPGRVRLIATFLAFIASPPLLAGPREDAEAAYAKAEYETATTLWRGLAEQGDADAEFHLGVMYAFDQGVPNDYRQAVAWYRKAADQGQRQAQIFLGYMYANGFGVPEDWTEAKKWYMLARKPDDTSAPNAPPAASDSTDTESTCWRR